MPTQRVKSADTLARVLSGAIVLRHKHMRERIVIVRIGLLNVDRADFIAMRIHVSYRAGVDMQILALLDFDTAKRLRAGVPQHHDMHQVDLATLERRSADPGPKLVVIDPAALRRDALHSLLETARLRPNIAVLIYGELTTETARATAAASRVFPVEAIFFGSVDERDALAHVCARPLEPSVSALMLGGLAPMIAMMPRSLGTRVVGLFGGRAIPRSTSGMLAELGAPVGTVHNWLLAAGVTKPRLLRACAILARAYPHLGSKDDRLEEIAEHVCIGSVRALARACRTLTGLPARRAGQLDEMEFARRMLSVLRDSQRISANDC